jgi:hypothetical protein
MVGRPWRVYLLSAPVTPQLVACVFLLELPSQTDWAPKNRQDRKVRLNTPGGAAALFVKNNTPVMSPTASVGYILPRFCRARRRCRCRCRCAVAGERRRRLPVSGGAVACAGVGGGGGGGAGGDGGVAGAGVDAGAGGGAGAMVAPAMVMPVVVAPVQAPPPSPAPSPPRRWSGRARSP